MTNAPETITVTTGVTEDTYFVPRVVLRDDQLDLIRQIVREEIRVALKSQ